jgi:cytochrome b6-f complex subunit 7
MVGEIFTAAIIPFTLILVGLSLGFLILKIQGAENE